MALGDMRSSYRLCLVASVGLSLALAAACKKQVPAAVPDSPTSTARLESDTANEHFFNGRYDEAIPEYERSLDREESNDSQALYRLALCYLLSNHRQSHLERAADLLEELSSDIERTDTLFHQAQVLLELSREIADLRRAVEDKGAELEEVRDQLEKLKEIDIRRRN